MNKIYIYDNEGGNSYSISPTDNVADKKHEIEYIRKEAILEWAKELDKDAIRRAGDNDMACGFHYALTELINKLNSL